MMRRLFGFAFADAAADYMDSLPSGKLRAQVAKKAKSLIENQYPPGCKKLVNILNGDEPVWRIRSGDYRILYVVRKNPDEVIVIDIDHRKDVYK